ncbi:MAG: amino acid ABC transporter permease [Deltaproteobacteria bacterium]|nr:amino acid ABC transporter permease [Deltaproteobacteria bacterium]MBW2306995.1 amino acid ABC transporter permease [Deltaproteobacteria bacterium]
MDWAVIPRNINFLLGGLVLTFELAAISLAGGFLLGIILGMARLSSRKWIYYPATIYINLFRSLPLILVIFWFYFMVPFIIGRPLGDFLSAIIAFIAFEASYFAEIVRGGIQSIPHGQVMAGYSTGLNYYETMRFIVLPQALRNMVPPIVTQCVIIFQDTSLAYVIGLKEFLRRTSLVDARELRSVELYLFAGLVYIVFCSIGTMASRRLEKRQTEG